MNRSAPLSERNASAKRPQPDKPIANKSTFPRSNSSTHGQTLTHATSANVRRAIKRQLQDTPYAQPPINQMEAEPHNDEPEPTEVVCQRLIELQSMRERAERLHIKKKERLLLLHERTNRSLAQSIRSQELEFQSLRNRLERPQQQVYGIQRQMKQQAIENAAARATIQQTAKAIEETQARMPTISATGKQLDEKLLVLEDVRRKRAFIHEEIASTKTSLVQAAKRRRKLHNTIQELKGNIRVFCRVRPVLQSDKSQEHIQIRYSSNDVTDTLELEENVSSMLGKRTTKQYSFTFDRIFEPTTTQRECYEDIAYLVQSALDGYSICIFAYGQTGSGKTYTMQGPATGTTPESAGMIPRAIAQMYDLAQELKAEGWEYTMEGQFLEIYNETIHDLLGDPAVYGKVKHEIHHAKNGRTTVTHLTTVPLDSPDALHAMLRKANHNRATAATNMNERSSRSHSVFTLRISGTNMSTNETVSGILNLVDLAGSERLALSGSTGERLRETQAINKSLSCLGDVIHALNSNSKTESNAHVPYRNSKLTYLLQNSLGGTSKTLMFVNISHLAEHFGETLCSLRFASKVNACRVELPQRVMK